MTTLAIAVAESGAASTVAAQAQLFATDPVVEALVVALADDEIVASGTEVRDDQMFLPGLLRFCRQCGEFEDFNFATPYCFFEQVEVAA